jgi:3-oxoacyl-[acyl-carrier protein] reductase
MLKDKVIAITGGGRGLGQAYAVEAARQGASVVVGDVLDCSETVAKVKAVGGRAHAAALDVTRGDTVQKFAQSAKDAFGGVDGLVNNAALYGALHGGRFDQIDDAEWDRCMAVNVKGIWNCCKAFVPLMRERKGGSIVNVASLAATYGMPYALHYTTSKAAVIGLTRGLAREIGRNDVRVNSIAPTAIVTEGTKEFFAAKLDTALETIKDGQSLKRNLYPDDVVGAVMWLLSDMSRFVTGQTIAIDGGTVLL